MALRMPPPPRRPVGRSKPPDNRPAQGVRYRAPDGSEYWASGQRVNHEAQGVVNLSAKHQLILWMDVAGERGVDIAQKIGLSQGAVSVIRNSPLYIEQRKLLVEHLATSRFDSFLDFLRQPHVTVRNVEVLLGLRDKIEEHGGDPKVRLAAAKQISHEIERVYPRTTRHEEERTVRITFDAQRLHRIATALAEAGAATPEVVIDVEPTDDDPDGRIRARSIEDLRADFAAGPANADGPG